MDSIKDFGIPIMNKDETFFKKDDYVSYAESFSNTSGLIDIWDNCNDVIKKSIWEYLQSIYVLGMNAINDQDTLQQVLCELKSKKI